MRTALDRIVREELNRGLGCEGKTMGDGFLATFDGPARACTPVRSRSKVTMSPGSAFEDAGEHQLKGVGDTRHLSG